MLKSFEQKSPPSDLHDRSNASCSFSQEFFNTKKHHRERERERERERGGERKKRHVKDVNHCFGRGRVGYNERVGRVGQREKRTQKEDIDAFRMSEKEEYREKEKKLEERKIKTENDCKKQKT